MALFPAITSITVRRGEVHQACGIEGHMILGGRQPGGLIDADLMDLADTIRVVDQGLTVLAHRVLLDTELMGHLSHRAGVTADLAQDSAPPPLVSRRRAENCSEDSVQVLAAHRGASQRQRRFTHTRRPGRPKAARSRYSTTIRS